MSARKVIALPQQASNGALANRNPTSAGLLRVFYRYCQFRYDISSTHWFLTVIQYPALATELVTVFFLQLK